MANEQTLELEQPTITEPKPTTAIVPVEKKEVIAVNDRGLAIATLDDAWRFAKMVVASGLAPSHYNTPEKVIIACQYGAEVGLSKMQSLQSIAVINGRPSMWGDALPGLVWGSGLCEDIKETIDGKAAERTATCIVKRKGAETPITATFSMADADRAGLLKKAGPWTQYPDRMLKIRARAFALRDAFADVLRGLQVREELEDIPVAEHTAPANYSLPLGE
jgi:hypothetical protein